MKEKSFTQTEMLEVLQVVGPNGILVGGQALAFWMMRLQMVDAPTLTKDADFLGDRALVFQIADEYDHAQAIFPSRKAITILTGQVHIFSGDGYRNVDVIGKVAGLSLNDVEKNAVTLELNQRSFKVMHPVHVFSSRLYNVARIKEKTGRSEYLEQARFAALMCGEFIRHTAQRNESEAMSILEQTLKVVRSSSGKYALRHGIDLRPALPIECIANPRFIQLRKERMMQEIEQCLAHSLTARPA